MDGPGPPEPGHRVVLRAPVLALCSGSPVGLTTLVVGVGEEPRPWLFLFREGRAPRWPRRPPAKHLGMVPRCRAPVHLSGRADYHMVVPSRDHHGGHVSHAQVSAGGLDSARRSSSPEDLLNGSRLYESTDAHHDCRHDTRLLGPVALLALAAEEDCRQERRTNEALVPGNWVRTRAASTAPWSRSAATS